MTTSRIVRIIVGFGDGGVGSIATNTMASTHIGAAIPDQTRTETRAQLRSRINPTPLKAPQIVTAKKIAMIAAVITRSPGLASIGLGYREESSSPIIPMRMPIAVTKLPSMAITPEAMTAADRCPVLFIGPAHHAES